MRKSARSFSIKKSDGSIKSSSSFHDKVEVNSIISEEDSAFGEQTPAIKNNDTAKNKDLTFNTKIEDHSARKTHNQSIPLQDSFNVEKMYQRQSTTN